MKLMGCFGSFVGPRQRLPAATEECTKVRRRRSDHSWTPTLGPISEHHKAGGNKRERVATVDVAAKKTTKAVAKSKGRAKSARLAAPSPHSDCSGNVVGFSTMAMVPTPFMF